MPINLAHKRWNHSQKKINLKSPSVKLLFKYLNCAICLYPWNACCHCVSFNGGMAPIIGSHSVIESPEPVNLVMPPSNTCTINMPTPINNHLAIMRFCFSALIIFSLYFVIIFCVPGCIASIKLRCVAHLYCSVQSNFRETSNVRRVNCFAFHGSRPTFNEMICTHSKFSFCELF